MIKLTDLAGNVIFEKNLTGTGIIQQVNVDAPKMTPGIYQLEVRVNNEQRLIKLIKQ